MRTIKRLSLSAIAGLALCGSAIADDFPERSIQNIYPWAPGTITYGISQIIADGMSERLGQALPVIATPGAGGVKAFETALSREADGYIIIDGYVAPLVIAPMFERANWACEDFTPLYSATANAMGIGVRIDDDRFTDFPSFIEFLQANPGETAYNGNGLTLPHMVGARVMQQMGTVSRPIPYDDAGLGLKDLRAGVLDWVILNPGQYEANKDHVRILVALSESESVADAFGGSPRPVDYGIDVGLTGLAPMGWNWWLVASETPEDRVQVLRDAMRDTLADEAIRERITDAGYIVTDYSPDQYLEVCNAVKEQLSQARDAITWEADAVKALN